MKKLLLLLLMILPFFGTSQEVVKNKVLEDWRAYTHSFRPDTANLMDVEGVRLTKAYYWLCEENQMSDNIEFCFLGEAAIKTRTSTIYDYIEKLYDLSVTGDGTQTTASNQPYLTGNIAPTERKGIKNPNGDSRYITHPEISFGATDAWSVTTVLNLDIAGFVHYASNITNTNYLEIRDDSIRISTTAGAYAIASYNAYKILSKNTVVTFSVSSGNLSLYINGILINSSSISGDITFSNILSRYSAYSVKGSVSAHVIRNIALTPTQVAAEAAWLQTVYPEIPTVQIGTQNWQTSNYDAVATPAGNVIENVTEAVNVEKVTNGEFTGGTIGWSVPAGWVYGTDNLIGTNVSNTLYQLGALSLGKYYKVSLDVTSYTSGDLGWNQWTGVIGSFNITGTGTYTLYGKITATTNPDRLLISGSSFTGTIDNVSAEEVGWAGSQDLYDGLITQGESVQAALEASAMWCYYDNDSQLGAVYGKLYNWFAVSLIQQDIDLYNAANPDNEWGYHVPTLTEFTTLQTYLGGSTVAGGKMKKEGLDYWNSPNTGATNFSGFSALGSGYRSSVDGSFGPTKSSAFFYTITPFSGIFNYKYRLDYNSFGSILDYSAAGFGFSLRLIKD